MKRLALGSVRVARLRGERRSTVVRSAALWIVLAAGGSPALVAEPAEAADLASLASCRWAVEEVYWRHRIWPESNPGPKPALAEILAWETVERRMDDALRQVTALEEGWHVRLDGAVLQRELDRMARDTKDPEMLRELFAATGGGERAALCLALPELAKSRLSGLYAEDPEIHRPLREQAETALASVSQLEALADLGAEVSETVLVRSQESAAAGLDLGGELALDSEQWSAQVASLARAFVELDGFVPFASPARSSRRIERAGELPVGRRSRLVETPEAFVVREVREASEERLVVATATWRKRPVDLWWQERRAEVERAAIAAESVTLPEITATPCVDDTWTPTAVDYLPEARYGHVAVWTGTEMVVWGGWGGALLATGGRYSPATDTWLPTTTTGAPSARWFSTAVWTGSQMIVWGGASTVSGGPLDTGARYTPGSDQWSGISTGDHLPAARFHNAAVWTGNQMIVWGGIGGIGVAIDSGGIYTPATNLWSPMEGTPPAARFWASAVWTGTQMIVWGGQNSVGTALQSGGVYTPGAPGNWSSMSATGAPSARALHSAIWVGPPVNRMVLWGGRGAPASPLGDGARYDPIANGWSPMASTGAPSARYFHTATWTGNEMVVWGGTTDEASGLSTGARYSPVSDTWAGATPGSAAPSARFLHTAVWTGEDVILWGGTGADSVRDSGARYDPDLDSWTQTKRSRTPAARAWYAAAWTGTEMLVWGGDTASGKTNTGGRYVPATDTWSPLSSVPSLTPASGVGSVWTGTEWIVWGGYDETGWGLRNGGRYAPAIDAWTTVTDVGAPSPRGSHGMAWTGQELVLWGGFYFPNSLADGGRFVPGTGWSSLPPPPLSLSARYDHVLTWTGSEVLVWGGNNSARDPEPGRAGARYFPPPLDAWVPIELASAPPGRLSTADAWTGAEMIVWGGSGCFPDCFLNDGSRYRPLLDVWAPLSGTAAPQARAGHTAIWTGAEMIVWGGATGLANRTNTGGRYRPAYDSWQSTSTQGAPVPRNGHAALWTGRQMIVWGGYLGYTASHMNTGGLYCATRIFEDGFEGGDTSAWRPTAP